MPPPRGAPLPPSAAAKVHLELALLILSPLPFGPPRLKLHAHSHLAGAYAVMGAVASQRSSRQHSPSTETWSQRSPPSWWREPPPHIGSPQIKLSFAAPALCIHLLCCEDSAAVESSVAQATQLGDAFPVV
nr:unnamed protein product [Digitaria exilis]